MKRLVVSLVPGLVLALCGGAAEAQVLRLCVDAQGHKTYKQGACPELGVKSGVEPVAADALTEKEVLESLKRFDTAMAKRDATAIAGLLDAEFHATVYRVLEDGSHQHLDGYSRRSFINVVSQNADVMSKYSSARSNCKVELKKPTEALAVCDTQESFNVTAHTGNLRSKEHARVVVSGGHVLLTDLDQYVEDFDVKTETLQVDDPRASKRKR